MQKNPPAATDARAVRSAWIEATRPRTLPLAASGALIAAGIATSRGCFRWDVFACMLAVSVLLQVIANFADDYGDLSHGLDDETRVGPKRGMQRGVITPAQMKRALAAMCLATLALGCLLIWISFAGGGEAPDARSLTAMGGLLALGLGAMAAAVLYTVGPHPYGYLGLGDIMSFIFFGIVAVAAGSFLYTHALDGAALAAGIALGLPVAAVMNINNMRDATDDAAKGKRTIANRLYLAGEREGASRTEGLSPQEVAALVAVLVHGPKVDGDAFESEVAAAGESAQRRVTDPACAAALFGEVRMRTYHLALIYASMALFVAALFALEGASLATFIGAAAVVAAFTPLLRATQGVCHQLDHTKLDRFMAPTSLGTVLVAIVFSLAAALI